MEFGIKTDKITKSLLRTTFKKALNDIRRDPKRSMRNLVDLGLNFAEGCNQREIFDITQHYLSNENSSYYRLAENIVKEIDDEKLITFGLNFGYNGCTSGAKLLREKEAQLGCHIPFMLSFTLGEEDSLTVEDITSAIKQGMELGIYIYSVICFSDDYPQLLEMAAEFDECAFLFFINPIRLTREVISRTSELNNLVTSVHFDGESDSCINAVRQLREQGCITVVHYEYTEQSINEILSNVITDQIAEMGTIAGIFYTSPETDKDAQKIVADYRTEIVRSQQYPLFLFEEKSDIARIEQMFSNAECFLRFTNGGRALYTSKHKVLEGVNLRTDSLTDILKRLKY
ncbi:MAG: hypothetical protein LUE12_05185 [Ruminococcus sp.]|nr:hypothetical protein [Ruminococcus sp.]